MKVSRFFLFASLILVLLTAACAAEGGTTPTLVGITLPDEGDLTGTPFETETTATAETATVDGTGIAEGTATADGSLTAEATNGAATQATAVGSPAAGTTQRPGIPVTGADIVLVECQFCVDTWAHALLVLPDTATFEIVSPAPAITTSTTADTTPNCSTVEVNNGRQIVLCSGPETTPITLNICTDVNTCTDIPINLMACPLNQQPATGAGAAETEDAAATTTTTPGVGISTATP